MRGKPETLLILSPGFPEDEADTACIPPQQEFVKALKKIFPGLNVVVLSFQYPFQYADYEWNGMRVIALGGKSRPRFKRVGIWLRAGFWMIRLQREYRLIGLLSFWLGECAFVASWFARTARLKHFCWILGQDARAGNKYVRWSKLPGNELIALSDFIRREFLKNYGVTPAHIIPVGVNPESFPVTWQNRDIDLIGAGSLIPLKQYHLFIEIVARLKPSFPSVRAVLCGAGPEMARLRTMIRALDLEANIELKGELPHAEVLAQMQCSKILLHTSEYEGFGAVCLEALYAGAQVVSFVKPMDATIKNWYTVENEEEMLRKTTMLLQAKFEKRSPVIPFEISHNVLKMMELYGYKEAAIV